MSIKKAINDFKKGYNRPISMPNWKWFIIYLVFGISLLFYIFSIIVIPYLIFLGVLFQCLGFELQNRWDSGEWKKTKKGQEYMENYNNKEK